jgi:hypothetical protein
LRCSARARSLDVGSVLDVGICKGASVKSGTRGGGGSY